MGGGKSDYKLPMVGNLLPKVDQIIVCSALALTFWKALGYEIGKNPVAVDWLSKVKNWLKVYANKIILPLDFATSKKFDNSPFQYKDYYQLLNDDLCLDTGPKSWEKFDKTLVKSKLIVCNWFPDVFEWSNFQVGTKRILQKLMKISNDCQVVVGGGGNSTSATFKFKMDFDVNNFAHISTGGGAFLMLLETKKLPVVEKLQQLVSSSWSTKK